MAIIIDKTLIEVTEAKEGLDSFDRLRLLLGRDYLYLVWIYLDAVR